MNLRWLAPVAAALLVAGCENPPRYPSPPTPPPPPAPTTSPEQVRFEKGAALAKSYCGACHTKDLMEAQHLDRSNWDWVLDDMIEEYGARWITPEERELLLDFLVEEHGPLE